jgi:hypothetical protein
LNAETFSQPGIAANAATAEMSYGGVIAKSLLLLVLTFACAVVGIPKLAVPAGIFDALPSGNR